MDNHLLWYAGHETNLVEDAMLLSSSDDFNIHGEERLTYIGSLSQSVMQNVEGDLKAKEPKQTVTSLEL